ncbi:DUF1254 domain-containing protein [Rhodoblastus sp. 17X3]|uniref:DUF1254 domain-containing protein n=1 Tax=Rhodoblastus sp. 17X3 TaxID=3047026 RepID=UPI0024B64102|nr:DUF1254 domain-containing protein [Rhodoblastus sp. 17X3]MDI9846750.1 DUF1254 domain-containing protein [Rhodoblastus sp. 17X3]
MRKTFALVAAAAISTGWSAEAQDPQPKATPVNVENFARAESDLYFAGIVKNGGFGKLDHTREPAPLDRQTVIRLNRDTLYSSAVFDLDAGPVTITIPDAGQRFISMQVFDEDQYTHQVAHGPGAYTLTRDAIGTRYVAVAFRTLADPANKQDMEQAHAVQDAIKVEQPGGPGKFEAPAWDQASQKKVRDLLIALADTLPDKNRMFGTRAEVDPVRFLLGAASAWGGNPDKEAIYLNVVPEKNDGKVVYGLKVPASVPVDGFWSVTVYNAEGFFTPNAYDAYSLNNITAQKSADGGVNIQFGDCDGKIPNCLPVTAGWNYMIRLYRPHQEILNGSWTFPAAVAR